MIKKDDYVINTVSLASDDIEKNSVGIVTKLKKDTIEVFFIGKSKKVSVKPTQIKFLDIEKTGKGYSKKICNVCYVLKDYYQDFAVNQTDAYGGKTTRPTCRQCRKYIDGESLKSSEKKRMEGIKPTKLFTCPICGKSSIPFVTANLVIDHNHKTGMAREWICDSCNTGLGRFKDDIDVMKKAIEYLKKYEKS